MEKSFRIVNSLTFQFELTSRILYKYAQKSFGSMVKNKITLEEYLLMDTLICYPHSDKNALAASLCKEQSVVDKLISSLIKKKYIRQVKEDKNKIRVQYYELTREGQNLCQECVPQRDLMVEVLSRFITEAELVNFTKTLLKIRNILISISEV